MKHSRTFLVSALIPGNTHTSDTSSFVSSSTIAIEAMSEFILSTERFSLGYFFLEDLSKKSQKKSEKMLTPHISKKNQKSTKDG